MGKKLILGVNDLASQRPDVASKWHSTMNGKLKPSEVMKGTHKDAWWENDCFQDGVIHEWHMSINQMAYKGCAICHGKQIQIGMNDLASQRPELMLKWDYSKNVGIDPDFLNRGNHLKV